MPTRIDKRQARDQAIRQFQSWRLNDDLVILDLETTGFSGADEIVEIAAATIGGEVIIDKLVRPSFAIPQHATAVHGITNRMVVRERNFALLCTYLKDRLEGREIVAYNAAFERRMLEGAFRRVGVEPPSITWHCAMIEYARFRSIQGKRKAWKWHKLADACGHLEIQIPEERQSHRALDDCRLVWQIINQVSKVEPFDLFAPET